MYKTIKVEHPNGYTGLLYGRSSMAIFDKDGNEVMHTGFRSINTEKALYGFLEKQPERNRLLDMVLKAEGVEEEKDGAV